MRASIKVAHYKTCNEGVLLKRKYLDWKLMLKDLRNSGLIGSKRFFEHLKGNYAVGLLKTSAESKFYYSTTMVKNRENYNSFKDLINRIRSSNLITLIQRDEMINNLYYQSDLFYNYIEVDRSRGVRTTDAWSRIHDSESVILENMTKYIFDNKISDFKVFIYTHKDPCLNCDLIFQQFVERHPFCELTILYHQTNTLSLPSKYNWRYR